MKKRKLEDSNNKLEPLSKKRKLNDNISNNRRVFLTKDKKSWVDIFDLPKELKITKEDQTKLWDMHPKELGSVKLYGKEMNTPRYHQSYGKPYHFSGKEHPALPFPDIIQRYLNYANSFDEYTSNYSTFNMCLVNWYILNLFFFN